MITSTPISRRAVITGLGVVAPNGIGTEEWWQATKEGRSGIGPITHFDPSKYPTSLAGQVDGFEASDYIDQRLIVQTDRWTWMALAATQMALADAAFEPDGQEPERMSVITASSSGGNEFGQREIQSLWGKGPIFVGAYQSIAWFYAATTGQISIKHGMKGPCGVVIAEGAGALEALWHARRTIRRGVDLVVSGGTEAPIGPYALTCQLQNGRLSAASEAADAYRPFDVRANGYVPGEGGAIIIVEGLDTAQQRGAPQIYAEVIGYGATNDAQDAKRAPSDSRHLARAMSLALERAGIGPDEIDAVFADAAGDSRVGRRRGRGDPGRLRRARGEGSRDCPEDDDRPAVRGWSIARRCRSCPGNAGRVHPPDDQPRRARAGLRTRLRGGIGEGRIARDGSRECAGVRGVQRGNGPPPRRRTDSLTRMAVASLTTACRIDLLLAETVRRQPAQAALVWGSAELDYRSLGSAAELLAERMLRSGSLRGARVVIIAPNVPALVVALFATWMLEAVAVPLNARLREHEIRQVLEDAEPTLVLSVNAHLGFSFRDLIGGLLPGSPTVRSALFLGLLGEVEFEVAGSVDRDSEPLGPEVGGLLYTSGTTGAPQGAVVSHIRERGAARELASILGSCSRRQECVRGADRPRVRLHLPAREHLGRLLGPPRRVDLHPAPTTRGVSRGGR